MGASRLPEAVRVWRATSAGGSIEFHLTHQAAARALERVGNRWGALFDPEGEDVLGQLEALPRLADLADVCGAATVSEAYAWQAAVIDDGLHLWRQDPGRYAPFVVSGNIGAGAHAWAASPVRCLGRSYRQPVLDCGSPLVSERRKRQIRGGKVILSGLALSGGYLRFGPAQMRALPVPLPAVPDPTPASAMGVTGTSP